MTNRQKVDEIRALITYLQRYIENNVKNSFTDIAFSLENVIRDILNVFEAGKGYTNINSIQHNYPAVDLVNNENKVAIQVTTNANSTKVNKTIDTYNRHNLSYNKLIILGFVNYSKNTAVTSADIVGVSYIMNLIQHATSEQLDKVYDILHRQIPWNILHPLDDKMCYEVVLDVLDRSAIRDNRGCEGSYDHMVDGLKEIKEIITSGKVTGKSIRAKALSEYAPKVHDELLEIEYKVSSIIQICNRNRSSGNGYMVNLNSTETEAIDKLKDEVVISANNLAKALEIKRRIKRG